VASVTRKNQIAAMVRTLPAVAALQELWQQRTAEGETEEEYWAFLTWLDAGDKRGSPDSAMQTAARRWDWAGRALAYERAAGLNAPPGATAEMEIVDNLTKMVQMEVRKLIKRSATEQGEVMSIQDITKVVATLTDLQKTNIKAQSEKADLSRLTSEQIQQVLAAQKILREVSKK
jgi:hypothetical protein